MPKKIDLIGRRFGRLTVIGEAEREGPQGQIYWVCKCDCGNHTTVRGLKLRYNHTKSCGCLWRKHGHTNSETYRTWTNMKQRCSNKKHDSYCVYGKKGIKVCDRWVDSFNNFLDDMGEKPKGKSIDRIDSDGDYEPSNCRWANIYEQNQNRVTVNNAKGCCYIPRIKKWKSQIKRNNKTYFLGYFKTQKEAKRQYDIMAMRLRDVD